MSDIYENCIGIARAINADAPRLLSSMAQAEEFRDEYCKKIVKHKRMDQLMFENENSEEAIIAFDYLLQSGIIQIRFNFDCRTTDNFMCEGFYHDCFLNFKNLKKNERSGKIISVIQELHDTGLKKELYKFYTDTKDIHRDSIEVEYIRLNTVGIFSLHHLVAMSTDYQHKFMTSDEYNWNFDCAIIRKDDRYPDKMTYGDPLLALAELGITQYPTEAELEKCRKLKVL